MFEGKKVLVTGGTGSLGKVLVHRLLSGSAGTPKKIIVLSRDEAKQHFMRVEYQQKKAVTDEVIYHNFEALLDFRIGDVRDYHSVCSVLRDVDMVINAAALKQVPVCEYFPFEAVRTNVEGAENIVRAIIEHDFNIETVVGVSTDKACKPVNVMGMTKAIQERVFIRGNLYRPNTRFVCVRYGNVLASRGSVIPLFHEQIKNGGPLTITTTDMTRFLLPLERAVDTIIAALDIAKPGETMVPKVPAAKIIDLASVLIDHRDIETKITGIRPGEKIHEIMVSEEEGWRTFARGNYYAIKPMLPELIKDPNEANPLGAEYASNTDLMDKKDIKTLLSNYNLLIGQKLALEGEILR